MSEEASPHARFSEAYAGVPPWEIGKPQRPFVAAADQVTSPVLDAGCGTGNASVFFAARGHQVTGIDFVEEAIRQARTKAAERGLAVEFLIKDAMTLNTWDRRFRSVIDSGLFHTFVGEERRRYVKGLAHVTVPGGRLFLLSFTDEERDRGPAGASRQGIDDAFADDWIVESVEFVHGEVSAGFVADFPEGGPRMWFAIIRRKG
jgi:cyclopropane fatty-acyl-phospholipid synthase-like methyltransferase